MKNRIRTFLADRRARKARDRHLAMLNAKIKDRQEAHGEVNSVVLERRAYTHEALRR